MNVHEHQAKKILKEFGVAVPNGVVIFNVDDLKNKVKKFKTSNLIVKAQIHAGGRGKAGGIKIVNNENELIKEASNMLGKTLVTHQMMAEQKLEQQMQQQLVHLLMLVILSIQ